MVKYSVKESYFRLIHGFANLFRYEFFPFFIPTQNTSECNNCSNITVQREGETDDSLSESSDSYNSTSSSSSESGAYNNKKKHLDSDATTASYSSLEDDEATAANIIHDKTSEY